MYIDTRLDKPSCLVDVFQEACPYFTVLRSYAGHVMLGFFLWVLAILTRGPPAYRAGTLTTKPSSQLLQKAFKSIGIKYRKDENPQKSVSWILELIKLRRIECAKRTS